jgi:hypothetical protein
LKNFEQIEIPTEFVLFNKNLNNLKTVRLSSLNSSTTPALKYRVFLLFQLKSRSLRSNITTSNITRSNITRSNITRSNITRSNITRSNSKKYKGGKKKSKTKKIIRYVD